MVATAPSTAETAQQSASALAERAAMELRALWPYLEGYDAGEMKDKLLQLLPDILGPHHEAAAGLARDWYTAERPPGAPKFLAKMTEPAGQGRFVELINVGLSPLFKRGTDRNFAWAQEKTEGLAESLVLSGFRDTIAENSERDPAAESWERTLSPGACDWCKTFAHDIYHTAGQFQSHHHCRCTNSPRFKSYPDPKSKTKKVVSTKERKSIQESLDAARAEIDAVS